MNRNPQYFIRLHRAVVVLMSVIFFGCAGVAVTPSSAESPQLSGITQSLVDLMNKQDATKITAEDYASTSLGHIITFATPAGYRIKLRYVEYGVSLVEALKNARDPELRRRLIEMVQWSRRDKVRAEAIITLASLYDPSHKRYFKEALLDNRVGIRFAAVEALQIWNQPDSIPLLKMAMERDFSPLMKIYAAQALLSMGDNSGLDVLWKSLDHDSWVIRAMAARFLGDYANPTDYPKIVSYLNRESRNDFVIAEYSIAALKLISKKNEKVSYSPATKGWRDNDEVAYTLGRDNVVELEPLIIVPPQLRIPASLQAAAQINTQLLRLIRDRLGVPLEASQQQDPVLQDLNAMVTPTGFALKMRYSELSYLLIEALGGTRDPIMRMQLQQMASSDRNPLVRASAMIALAYNRDENDFYIMQDALRDKSALVRMGALEAIEVGRFKSAIPLVLGLAGSDPSPALQVYAMQVLAKFDNPAGRQMLVGQLSNPDWPARAMAYWYTGRYGAPEDFSMILARLSVEDNPFVQTEVDLAALRLAPLEE